MRQDDYAFVAVCNVGGGGVPGGFMLDPETCLSQLCHLAAFMPPDVTYALYVGTTQWRWNGHGLRVGPPPPRFAATKKTTKKKARGRR